MNDTPRRSSDTSTASPPAAARSNASSSSPELPLSSSPNASIDRAFPESAVSIRKLAPKPPCRAGSRDPAHVAEMALRGLLGLGAGRAERDGTVSSASPSAL